MYQQHHHPRTPSKTKIIVILFILFLTSSESFVIDEILKQTSVTYRLLNWARTLFPPDLDFRARKSSDEARTTEGEGEGGTGTTAEKVKEAVAKGKASVEESAKSAAEITKEKVKETFTSSHEL